jgi:hypothetical protein
MAAFAVFLENFSAMLGEPDGFRDLPGIELDGIPHSFNAFPGDVAREVVVGKMTVDAFEPPMAAIVEPTLIFGLHDVAACAKFRRSGSGIEPRRAKARKGADPEHNQKQKT